MLMGGRISPITARADKYDPQIGFARGLMENSLFPPDDYFLQDIEKYRGLRYTLGKEGYD
ncbi:MAG: hypothetical protein RSC56_03020 [Acidaminococcaceae bacterium]